MGSFVGNCHVWIFRGLWWSKLDSDSFYHLFIDVILDLTIPSVLQLQKNESQLLGFRSLK